jgi:hypothetical protein
MKIRNGFVSNSSSSSFLIWGARIAQDTLSYPDGTNECDFVDENDGLVRNAGPNDDYYFYIGRSPSKCGGDETMNQFKARVEAEVKELLQKHSAPTDSVRFGWQSEAWYDG